MGLCRAYAEAFLAAGKVSRAAMLLEQETLLWASVDNRQNLHPCLHLGNLGRSGPVKTASIVRDMVRAWPCLIWTVAKQGHNPPFCHCEGRSPAVISFPHCASRLTDL